MKISTSMLTVTENINQKIQELNESTTDYFHLDVMDGKFVAGNTIEQMDQFLETNKKPLDIHLMVEDIEHFIQKYKKYQPEYITFHIEVAKDAKYYIEFLHHLNIKAGIAINPDTDIKEISSLLPYLDLVLIMSVNPGKGGQSFIRKIIEKIEWLKRMRLEYHYSYQIEVDGGINENTVSYVKDADIVVSGSYITNGNFNENIWKLKVTK